MLEKLEQSAGPVVGYKTLGKITVEDYQQLEPEMLLLVDKYDGVCLLLDLQDFAGEEIKAWLPDLKFGHNFHDKINRMAIVGDNHWEKWMTDLAGPWYAKEARFFHPEETDNAWDWLRQGC